MCNEGDPRAFVSLVQGPSDIEEGVAGCGGDIYNVFNRLNSRLHDLELAWCEFPVGEVSKEHRHLWTEEMYIVVSGSGEIRINGDDMRVSAGSAIALPVGTWHQMVNDGAQPLLFWSVNSCPYDPNDIHYKEEL